MKKIFQIFAALFFCALALAAAPAGARIERLRNGIPLYAVESGANKVVSISIVVSSGAAFLDEDTSGLEACAFEMMKYGSKKFSYSEALSLSYDCNFKLETEANQDYAAISITFVDWHLKKALALLRDSFMNPLFEEDKAALLREELAAELQRKREDPEAMLTDIVSREIFKGHPYNVKSFVTEKSFPSVTVKNMREAHARDLDARRIFVVAVGDVKAKKIARILDKTIGKIPERDDEIEKRDIPRLKAGGENIVAICDAARGSGYMRLVFPGPIFSDGDVLASLVAAELYSQQLFNIAREKYGVCYSAQGLGGVGRVGSVGAYLYRVSDVSRAASCEREARALLSEGKVAVGKNDNGEFQYSRIDDALEGVKNKFLNSLYASSASNSGLRDRMAASVSLFGDPFAYDEFMARIEYVGAEDALAAFNKYWSGAGRWFAVVGPESEGKVKF